MSVAMQMFIVTFRNEGTPETSHEVHDHVRQCGGFVLMATKNGPLVLLESTAVAAVAKHPQVGFVGPVTLDPSGSAAGRLQRVFLENLSKQLETRKTDRVESTP